MVSAWLIITAIVFSVVVLFMSLLILAYFGHPDDQSEAYFPKIVTVLGLSVAFASVLVLPYDVANSRGDGGGLRVDILWQIIYLVIAAFIGVLIPYAFFFYEADTDDEKSLGCCHTQCCSSIWLTLAFFVVFGAILVIMFALLNTAEIPVTRIAQNSELVFGIDATVASSRPCADNCLIDEFRWELNVTFPVYVMAFLSFIGWWFFSFFVGVGLVALPIDLINEWRTRPEPLTTAQWIERKRDLGHRAGLLISAGKGLVNEHNEYDSMSRKRRSEHKSTLRRFEQAFYFLKQDYEVLRVARELKGGNPLWYAFKLVLGCLGVLISLAWIVHIAVFVLPSPPAHPFLNDMFVELEEAFGGGFPLFGIVAFGIFAFYLLWCCVKGNFKLGVRLLCMKVYPMELHKTLMNAFLVNTWIILVCSVPVVQFCVQAFPIYARFTSVDLLFGTQVQYLRFFRYFWEENVFIYIILGVNFLTIVWLVLRPRDKSAEIERELRNVAKDIEERQVHTYA